MIRSAILVVLGVAITVPLGGCGDDSTGSRNRPSRPRSTAETERARFYAAVREAGRARRAGDWEQAVVQLEAALSRRPDHESSLVDLAVALRKLERRDDAIEVLERLLAAHPGLPRSHVLLADVLAEPTDATAERLQRAEDLYRHALGMEPNVAGPRIGLARVLFRRGEAAAAELEFRTVIGIDENNVVALTGIADALLAQDRPADSVPLALRAIAAGTKATGRADVPSEMDTAASFEKGSLQSERVKPALRALLRAKEAVGKWPDSVPAVIRAAAERVEKDIP